MKRTRKPKTPPRGAPKGNTNAKGEGPPRLMVAVRVAPATWEALRARSGPGGMGRALDNLMAAVVAAEGPAPRVAPDYLRDLGMQIGQKHGADPELREVARVLALAAGALERGNR